MVLTSSMKQQLVGRLVGHELEGWRSGWAAGQKAAMNSLTVAGFEAVTALRKPTFKKLKALLRCREDSEQEVDDYWRVVAGVNFRTLTAHPDFPRAFVEAVSEVWDEVRDEVIAELECPRPREIGEPAAEQVEESPVRPSRRRQSRRGAGARPGLHRRW